jgi:hypothetical protein
MKKLFSEVKAAGIGLKYKFDSKNGYPEKNLFLIYFFIFLTIFYQK